MRSEKISFPGSQGHMLDARLDHPQGTPLATALFAHCFTCSKASRAATEISRALTRHGFAVLRFDFTGLGGSEGDFANTDFSSNVQDIVTAARHLENRDMPPALFIGHSLGGAAVIKAAAELETVRAVATIGAPDDPGHVAHQFQADLDAIKRDGKAEVSLAGRPFTISQQFVEDIAEASLKEALAGLNAALLICHAPDDDTVGIQNATGLFVNAQHPKSFISLDGADHLLTDKSDSHYLAGLISSWARRYLGPQTTEDTPKLEQGETLVREDGTGRYANDVWYGAHHGRADEPERLGGQDTGPTPYEYLTAALGACTTITLRMYADRKGWPVDRLEASVFHEKVHAEDCAECETKTGKIDRLDISLHIEGDLDQAQRDKLLEMAHRCPVHQTLITETKVEVALV